MQQFNQQSNSISIGVALAQNIKRNKKPQLNYQQYISQLIQSLDHKLITSISIITPMRLNSFIYRKQLHNYRFQRKQKSQNLFNSISSNNNVLSQQKQSQQLLITFQQIFSEWRNKLDNKMFVTINNGDFIYFFHKPKEQQDHYVKNNNNNNNINNINNNNNNNNTNNNNNINNNINNANEKKGGSFVIISCKKSSYSVIFKQNRIPYQQIQKSQLQNQRLLIKNNAIQLFWRYFVNNSIQKSIYFQFITNFYFLNSFEILPIEYYNGKQQQPQFMHLAQDKINILGQVEKQLFLMKITGFWFKNNCKKMIQTIQKDKILSGRPFHVDMEIHKVTENYKSFIQKL